MVAHGGTSVAGSFIQTLTMVDVATGWTECMPLLTRESGLVVRDGPGAAALMSSTFVLRVCFGWEAKWT
jgi:hypothetical protein